MLTAMLAGLARGALADDKARGVRIGVFKRTDVLVAFYGSEIWDQHVKDLMKQREAAKAQGDEKKVKEIEAQGAKSQEYAHRQLAGEAPLDNIFEHIRDELPAVAKEANVSVIVEKPIHKTADVELVDVTEQLVKAFPPKKKYITERRHPADVINAAADT